MFLPLLLVLGWQTAGIFAAIEGLPDDVREEALASLTAEGNVADGHH
jgi:hypothetical protein